MAVKLGYKQTEVGVIPEDWGVSTVGSEFYIQLGKMLDSEKNVGEPRPFVGNRAVQWGRIDITDIGEIKLSRSDLQRFRLCEGDLLVCEGGEVGRAAIWRQPVAECYYQKALHRLRPKRGYNIQLMQYLLQQLSASGFLLNFVTQTSIAHLPKDKFQTVPIPLPPTKAEQEAIAEALSDADALIESLEQLIAKKRHFKQGAMQELLTGKRRLPCFKGEWQTRPLGEVIAHCSSGATPYRGRPEYYKGNIKWITSGELNYNIITDTLEKISIEAVEKTNLKLRPVGTFLMAITGLEAAGTRGACGIVGSPATTNQSCMAIYPTSELSPQYLYHYYVYRGNNLALEYCQGTKQQSYTAKLVRLLPVALPPSVEEQTIIATILSDMDAEIAALEGKLAKARQIKQGMMHNLLTGRIRLV